MPQLTAKEKKFINQLQKPGKTAARAMTTLSYVVFLFGGAVIVATMLYLRAHLNDNVVYSIGLPGIITGSIILVIGLFLILSIKRPGRKRSPLR
jgi:hypothetical protein